MENISCILWKHFTSVTLGSAVAPENSTALQQQSQTAQREQLYLFWAHELELNWLLRLRALPKYTLRTQHLKP